MKQENLKETEIGFYQYDALCSDCDQHDKCHIGGTINYNKVAKCYREMTQIAR